MILLSFIQWFTLSLLFEVSKHLAFTRKLHVSVRVIRVLEKRETVSHNNKWRKVVFVGADHSLSHSLSVVLSQSSDSIQWKRPWQAAETKTDKYKCSRCPSECLGQRSIAVQRRLWVQAEQKKGTACKKKKRCESRVWSCSGQTIRDSQCDRYKLTFERRVMFSPKWTIWTLKCVVHISIYHLSNKNDDHQTNKGGQCNFTMQPYSDRVD